jgi:asparagine synthase (glutamine-hydrolysing)
LKPGYWLLHNREDTKLERYWKLESKPHQDNLDATARTVRELLKDSVVRQLVSDVPVCTFLSGGIDSSTITAFATEHYKEVGKGQLHTFSIDYIDNDLFFKANDFQPNSDAIWVDRVSNYLGTRHHHIFNDTPELASYLYDAVLAKDLPGMADVDSSLLLFCREVKKEAKVALSGECADEMFGGYPWFHRPELFNANTFPWSLAIEERESILNPRIAKYINAREYIDKRYYETIKDVPRLEGESGEDARRRELFYLNINWFMATLLDRKDRMSMATGLEVRVPFCDHRLLEYVWNIPWELKYYNNIEKGILRYALQGVLPNEVLYRKKSPYPKTHNPSYLETIKKWLREIIDDSNAPLHEIVNTNMLRNMLDNDEALFKRPWFGQLMNTPQFFAYMIQINIWLEKYNVKIII